MAGIPGNQPDTTKHKTKALVYVNDSIALRNAVKQEITNSLDSISNDLDELKRLLKAYTENQQTKKPK